jgi:hypothetical protein
LFGSPDIGSVGIRASFQKLKFEFFKNPPS